MRPIRVFVVLGVIAACNRGGGDARVEGSQISNSAGEVALTDGGSLQYSITSERYKQWDAARQGLDRKVVARFGALLQPASPSDRSIARAVEYLEGEPRARQAIERAGMSVRDFVVMTVALEQEMRLASRRGATQSPEPMSALPPYPPYPVDSAYVPAYPRPLPPPRFLPSDTMPPMRDTLIAPRDSVAPRRDTVVPRRDSTFLPRPVPPHDTARDTTKVRRDTSRTPPDTIPQT